MSFLNKDQWVCVGIPFKIISLVVLQLRITLVSNNGPRKSKWSMSSESAEMVLILRTFGVTRTRHPMILRTIFMVPHFAGIWCYVGQHTEWVSSCERRWEQKWTWINLATWPGLAKVELSQLTTPEKTRRTTDTPSVFAPQRAPRTHQTRPWTCRRWRNHYGTPETARFGKNGPPQQHCNLGYSPKTTTQTFTDMALKSLGVRTLNLKKELLSLSLASKNRLFGGVSLWKNEKVSWIALLGGCKILEKGFRLLVHPCCGSHSIFRDTRTPAAPNLSVRKMVLAMGAATATQFLPMPRSSQAGPDCRGWS